MNNSKKNDGVKEDKKNDVNKLTEGQKRTIENIMRIFPTK